MKRAVHQRILALGLVALTGLGVTRASDDFYDRIGSALTFASTDARFRARVSGTLEFEGYALPQPSPGLLYTSGHALFNPRLILFLDAQLGAHTYLFAQGRVDRGFDPSSDAVSVRLDEYALRFSLLSRPRLRLQVGKFATVMGSWVARHGAWENPFITAPLPYENLTAIWHSVAPRSPGQLLAWAHVRPSPVRNLEQAEKPLRIPLVWGPSYSHGVALAAVLGRFDVAAEVKTQRRFLRGPTTGRPAASNGPNPPMRRGWDSAPMRVGIWGSPPAPVRFSSRRRDPRSCRIGRWRTIGKRWSPPTSALPGTIGSFGLRSTPRASLCRGSATPIPPPTTPRPNTSSLRAWPGPCAGINNSSPISATAAAGVRSGSGTGGWI